MTIRAKLNAAEFRMRASGRLLLAEMGFHGVGMEQMRQCLANISAIAQAAGWSEVELEEVADPGLLVAPPGVGPAPMAAGALRSMAFKDESAAGGVAPEDVRGEAVVHARFRATR